MSDSKKIFKSCSVIILAAGNSSRMESPKFALVFDKNHTFLEKIIQEYYDFGCEEIIVVLSKEGNLAADKLNLKLDKATIVINHHPEWERFYSIKVGLQSLMQQHPIFIHNVDNPFVNQEILKQVFKNHAPNEFIVPVFEGHGGHPVLLTNEIGKAIIEENKHDLILSDFLKHYPKKRIVVNDNNILININTQDLYQKKFYKSR